MLGIPGFCGAEGSRSAAEPLKNTILFQIYKYLAMAVSSGGGVMFLPCRYRSRYY